MKASNKKSEKKPLQKGRATVKKQNKKKTQAYKHLKNPPRKNCIRNKCR